LLGSVWPVLWSMAGAVVDGRCCGRWPVLRSMAGAAVDGRCCGGGWCSGWWLVGVVAAFWVAAGGSGGVTGAEPVAGIPVLIPGFVTETRVHGRFPGFATEAGIPGLIPGFVTEARIPGLVPGFVTEAGIPGLIPGFVTEARVHWRFPGFVTEARIPVLIPGFATVAAILMVRTGSVWPVLWRRLVGVLAGAAGAGWPVFWPRPGWPLGFWWCDLCWHRWPRPARSVCDPEVLLGSVGPVLSRWPVLWSMAGALVDGLCCGRWSVLRSMVCAAVDGLCCGRWSVLRSMAGAAVDGLCCRRWPVLWSMAGAVAAAGRGSGRVLWGCSGFWWCDRRWHRWPRPARSVCDPEVLLGSVWPVLWSMAVGAVDGGGRGRGGGWPRFWPRFWPGFWPGPVGLFRVLVV
jgi:hypothetical protein